MALSRILYSNTPRTHMMLPEVLAQLFRHCTSYLKLCLVGVNGAGMNKMKIELCYDPPLSIPYIMCEQGRSWPGAASAPALGPPEPRAQNMFLQ